jgi:hypothetical protein
MKKYSVQVISNDTIEDRQVMAGTPEEAAQLAAGEPVTRGAKGPRRVLRAKVYWLNGSTRTMARFYRSGS